MRYKEPVATGMIEKLLTTKEVMELLAVSQQTIWRAVREGRLRQTKLGPRVIRYRIDDIQAWINDGRGGT